MAALRIYSYKTAPRQQRGAVFLAKKAQPLRQGPLAARLRGNGGEMVGPEGFEPPTKAL